MPARENEKPAQSTARGKSLIFIGLWYGAITGFVLSVIYALVGLVIVFLVQGSFSFQGFVVYGIVYLGFGSILIYLLGILPATLYGLFTGLLLSALLERWRKQISRYVYSILSMIICLGIAELSHFILGVHPVLSFESIGGSSNDYVSFWPYDSYLFWIGFPTIIYIITGGWVGWKLYSAMLKKSGRTAESAA